jgi:hypothetical protein
MWISLTRLGFEAITFSISAEILPTAIPLLSAVIPINVIMHVAREVHNKSVGENASPFPLLSSGASVVSVLPERT